MNRKPFSPAGLRWPLLLMLPSLIIALVIIYLFTRTIPDTTGLKSIKVDSSSFLSLSSMHQTSTRNGIKEWRLEATSAKLMKADSQAVMEDVRLTFFLDNSGKVDLTARTGTLNTTTHDMTLSGAVKVIYEGYTLLTDKLHYEKKRHIMYSNDRTTIISGRSTIEADGFTTDIALKKTTFKGNVRGSFDETDRVRDRLRSLNF